MKMKNQRSIVEDCVEMEERNRSGCGKCERVEVEVS
jgi:hypothetical protein